MGALIGFIFGYVVGAKSGPDGYDKLVRSLRAIVDSDEWKGLVESATGAVRSTLAQGADPLAEELDVAAMWRRVSGNGDLVAALSKAVDSEELRRLLAAGTALLGGALARGSEARN